MKSENNKKYYLPIIYSIILAIGIVIGGILANSDQTARFRKSAKFNKLNDIVNYINEAYVDSISMDSITERAIIKIISELDPHSAYIPPAELKYITENMEGSFEGIGIEFQILNDTIIVITPIQGGPSEALGIRSGDRIVKINGKNVGGIGITTKDVVGYLRGEKGTNVEVNISRRGIKNEVKFTIKRDKIPITSVDVAYKVTNDIGYIKINKFGATTYDEFILALINLQSQNITKLILDLRGNPGGYLQIATELADEILPKGELIVYTEGKSKGKAKFFAKRTGRAEQLKIAVLINEGSASASEIIAGAIQDNDRGIVVGRRSFGKGLVQEEITFNDNSALRLTTSRYYTPSGRCIQKPYDLGHAESYETEIANRIKNGEMDDKDSIHFQDTLKYKTKKGRIMFAGGGIMPDFFVPVNKQENTMNIAHLLGTGSVQDYSFDFVDKNRAKFEHINLDEFVNKFDISKILSDCVKIAEKKHKKIFILNPYEVTFLKTFLKSQIARHLYGNEAYFRILNQKDDILKVAVEELNKLK